jgi:hypothetical protein
VFAYTAVRLTHWGEKGYTADPRELTARAASAAA